MAAYFFSLLGREVVGKEKSFYIGCEHGKKESDRGF